jgi:hypothetical protein
MATSATGHRHVTLGGQGALAGNEGSSSLRRRAFSGRVPVKAPKTSKWVLGFGDGFLNFFS